MTNIERLISRQIERWEHEHGTWLPSRGEEGEEPLHMPVIAIMPQLGSGSRLVTETLNRLTGYDIYGFKLIDEVAQNMNVRRELIDRMDQRLRSNIRSFIDGMLSNRHIEQEEYFRHLVEILEVFIYRGGVILLGRGAPFIVEQGQGIRVRLVAPLETRITNLMRFNSIGAREAENRIRLSDRERSEFAAKFYQKNLDDPKEYDLVINMAHFTPDTAAATILRALDAMINEPALARKARKLTRTEDAARIVERQIGRWDREEDARLGLEWDDVPGILEKRPHNPVVAFHPDFCSGSRLVSDEIRKRLQYEVFGYRIIDRVAEDMNLSPRIVDRLDHRAKTAIQALLERLTENVQVSRSEYFSSLVRVIRALILQGGVILLGRGSPFLVEKGEGLRIRLTASLAKRLENFHEFYGIGAEAAERKLAQGDRERGDFVRQYYKTEPDDLLNYDLGVNMDRLSPASAATAIFRAMEPLLIGS